MIQSPEHDLAEATDANCVIRILAERSLVQPTEKKQEVETTYNRAFPAIIFHRGKGNFKDSRF